MRRTSMSGFRSAGDNPRRRAARRHSTGYVSAHLTSGDPCRASPDAIEEYVHAKYVDGMNHVSQNGVTFLTFTADAWVDIYDDASKPTHRIVVSQPIPAQVKLLIPVHLKLSNMSSARRPA
jgi:hypothetical protein